MNEPAAKRPAKKAASAPPTEPTSTPTVVEALSRVMHDVRSVGKDSQAPGNIGGYRFRGVDAVVNAVGPALRTHGVVVMPEVLSVDRVTTQSKGGAQMLNVYVRTRFTFYGPAGDSMACTVLGEAADAGDKATAKAQSVALRVALLQALCLPTDETDPDAEGYERGQVQEGPDPRVYAPNGQPWLIDGKPNPDALETYQRKVWDAIGNLTSEEATAYNVWHQDQGLPQLRAMDAFHAQAAQSYLDELVAKRPPA